MPPDLPPALLAVDEALHALHERVAFSRFLNPTNSVEARAAFLDGAPEPPFAYQPAGWADEELRALDGLRPPEGHPLTPLFEEAIEGSRLFILALRDRSEGAFDALARRSGWYPDADTLARAAAEPVARDTSPYVLGAEPLMQALREALARRGLHDWRVEPDRVMSARVLVDGAKRLLRVNPLARFRQSDVRRLIVHEVDVHAVRSANGAAQPLRIFATGLPGSLETEEGLALVAEERAGAASPGTLWRQGVVVRAVEMARHMGFAELYRALAAEVGAGLAWGVSERLKRGLARPGAPGVYAKDIVYYRGVLRVRSWLDEGRPLSHLYVGKVGLDHPVADWLDQGLLKPMPVPGSWGRS